MAVATGSNRAKHHAHGRSRHEFPRSRGLQGGGLELRKGKRRSSADRRGKHRLTYTDQKAHPGRTHRASHSAHQRAQPGNTRIEPRPTLQLEEIATSRAYKIKQTRRSY